MMKPDTSEVAVSPPSAGRAPRLLTQLAEAIRIRHYSIRTEEAHVHGAKAFICCNGLPALLLKPYACFNY
jgi:hypothetical protein